MRHDQLEKMVKGWFVGGFTPAVLQSAQFEVAIKHYGAGDYEAAHFHAKATEITAVVSGRVRMCGADWGPGDILTIEPGETTDFLALTAATTVVVKAPSLTNDKFVVGNVGDNTYIEGGAPRHTSGHRES